MTAHESPLPADPVPFAREEESARLSTLLLLRLGSPRVLVLHGPAGVGKTTVALRVARNLAEPRSLSIHRQHWSGWAPVTLIRLYGRLGASRRTLVGLMALEDGTYPNVRDAVHRRLRELPGSVVVFDDVPSPYAAEELLGAFEGTETTVVVTSRAAEGWDALRGCHAHAVAPLDAGTSALLAGRPLRQARKVRAVTGGLPALLRLASGRKGRLPRRPGGLVLAAVDGISPAASQALSCLDHWGLERFSTETVARFGGSVLAELVSAGLVTAVGDGMYVLPSLVRDALPTTGPAESPAPLAEWLSRRERPERALDARHRARRADEYLDLVRQRGELLGDTELGRLFVTHFRHDHVVALKWIAAHQPLNARAGTELVATACASAAREAGRMLHARRELAEILPGPEQVLLDHQTGRLDRALDGMSRAERAGGGDRYQLTTVHAAVLNDQGYPAEAARLLAEEAGSGDSSPGIYVWRLIERARAHLLLGELEAAGTTLAIARHDIDGLDRDRAAAWITLQEARLLFQQTRFDRALARFREALDEHRVTEDVRGEAWTRYYTGVALARTRLPGRARSEMSTALALFRDLPDDLGQGWALHRLGLLARQAGDHAEAVLRLLDAAEVFVRIGCRHGSAWTELELAGLRPEHAAAHISTATEVFTRLQDGAGLLWCAYLRAALVERRPSAPDDVLEALREYGLVSPAEVAIRAQYWTRRRDPALHLAVPHGSRDTIIPLDAAAGARLLGKGCHVRLTLLDEPGTVVRLRVVPAADHPWATGQAARPPWLSVVATPLTGCSVEPASSLVRPSADPELGAEFRFSPYRPGLHRIRFTIAEEATGTVLQQVETEFDILDSEDEALTAAPHPAHVWRA
ncbi:AAA family ATPase [Streptomyces sp. NPDC101115]|uniref:AAA family ATPase n=1 Tax=Streptomyces sp. NPDC101115 TaxID=3366106 RepID=UPI0038106C11